MWWLSYNFVVLVVFVQYIFNIGLVLLELVALTLQVERRVEIIELTVQIVGR